MDIENRKENGEIFEWLMKHGYTRTYGGNRRWRFNSKGAYA